MFLYNNLRKSEPVGLEKKVFNKFLNCAYRTFGGITLSFLLGCASINPKIINNNSIIQKYNETSSVNIDDFKVWLNSKGELLVDLYEKSSQYPYGCIEMSNIADLLLKNEGIKSRVVEGYVENDSIFFNPNSYHVFNIVYVNNNGNDEEYVLDFTANQFTLEINQYTNNGVWNFEVVEPQTGKDIIPYFEKISESPYKIKNDFSLDKYSLNEFYEIYLKVLNSK